MKSLYFVILSSILVFSQPKVSEFSTLPGTFSRMGFGARGIGFGNTMSSITEGSLTSYYNPALSAFQDKNNVILGYTFLSNDRSLNFLNFTKRFDFYSTSQSGEKVLRSSAGVSAGIINSGVSKIDGRDNQGISTGELSTSENLFFLGLSNRFSNKLALGINIKFFYYKLYEDVSTTAFGLDIGGLYKFNDHLNLSVVLNNINSEYEWDTGKLYGEDGTTTTNEFPLQKIIGLSYRDNKSYIIAAEISFNGNNSTNLRFGFEYLILEEFVVRAGLDQIDLKNSDIPKKPSAGFSYSKKIDAYNFGFDYAFVYENVFNTTRHIIGLKFNF